jgi:riboflavin kinase/FMN adenylyltransferase
MKSVITIGSYDGVHKGHQKIIKEIKEISQKFLLKSVVVYFPIPPKLYLSKNYKENLITTPLEREKIIYQLGIDIVEKIDFTSEIAKMHAIDFFKNYLLKKFFPQFIVVGKDFSIGKNREANYKWLKEICLLNGIETKIIDFVKFENHKISSSLIRNFLHQGMIKEANKCMNRNYFIEGVVVRGNGIGRKIGFPTANIKTDPLKILPSGVFAVYINIGQNTYPGVCNIGFRPTIEDKLNKKTIEVHILDFNKDIYGEKVIVSFIDKIRNEKKFKNIYELINQIKMDIDFASDIFKKGVKIL